MGPIQEKGGGRSLETMIRPAYTAPRFMAIMFRPLNGKFIITNF